MSQQQKSSVIDRYPFWGTRTTKEIRFVRDTCAGKNKSLAVDRGTYRDLLKTAISSIESEDDVKYANFDTIAKEHNIENINGVICFYSGLLSLIKYAFKYSNVKQEHIKEDLRDQLKFPLDFVNDFVAVVYNTQKREVIERQLIKSSPHYPKLSKLEWRVDVSISTSTLSRTLEPTVLLKLKLDNGQIKTFELCTKKFHLLRFNIATILKEIEDLENRPTFKLFD